jgi:hypothetical protein
MQAIVKACASELGRGLSVSLAVFAGRQGCPPAHCAPVLNCAETVRCPDCVCTASGRVIERGCDDFVLYILLWFVLGIAVGYTVVRLLPQAVVATSDGSVGSSPRTSGGAVGLRPLQRGRSSHLASMAPATSRLWITPSVRHLLRRTVVSLCQTEFCMWGKPWRKSTKFLYAHVDLSAIALHRCLGSPPGICRRTGSHHICLQGKHPSGAWWTKVAEPYPSPLCKALALAFDNTVNARRSDCFQSLLVGKKSQGCFNCV